MLKLLLNVIIAGTEAFVISRNKYLYACVKKFATYELSHVLTFRHSSLLLKLCDPNQFFR
jgi:hypothetical protein